MGFESRGLGLGSTFFFELPLYSATTAAGAGLHLWTPTTTVGPSTSMDSPAGHRLSRSPVSSVDTIVDRHGGGAPSIVSDHILSPTGDDGNGDHGITQLGKQYCRTSNDGC